MDQRVIMRLCYCVVLAALVAVLLVFENNKKEFDDCVATSTAKYPSDHPMPLGQPFKDIYACMTEHDYMLDTQSFVCAHHGDYTTLVMDYRCYRPNNLVRGYLFDVRAGIR